MRYTKTTMATISMIVALVGFSVMGSQHNYIIAEELEDKGYTFAEDVKITGEFLFDKGIEVTEFQVYKQKHGFDHTEKPAFTIEKVSNGTPLLYAAADEAYYQNKDGFPQNEFEDFDVNIILSREGDLVRVFEYENCEVIDYSVKTEYDKEEGYISSSKGFAVIDTFEISCYGYEPVNPQYEKSKNERNMKENPNLNNGESEAGLN